MPSLVTSTWLEDQNQVRALFAEIIIKNTSGVTQPAIYLSTTGYLTSNGVTQFNPIISKNFSITESMSLDSSNASISYGDLEIDNLNGEYDNWLTDYIWANGTLKVYYGDPFWVSTDITAFKSNFELVFDGIIANIDSKSRDTLNIKVRDKLERLNAPITEELIGTTGTWGTSGGQPNTNNIKPLIFGEVHNISPELIDPVPTGYAGEYIVNNGAIESIIEIRDNGVPIYNSTLTSGAVIDATNGKFKLAKPLYGTCTASVQGVNNSINLSTGSLVTGTYTNNIAQIIALIVTQYGAAANRFTTSELDLANLSSFSASNTQAVGVSIADRVNLLNVCQDLAASIGAQLFITRQGLLKLLRLETPTSATFTITDSDILYNSLSISNRTDVIGSVKLGYCKNYTIQPGLVTGIPTAHKEMFAAEWQDPAKAFDTTILGYYVLEQEVPQKDTLLIIKSEAETEATRLLNYYKTQRTIYKFTGISRLLSLSLGQSVTLTHNRFGLSSGVLGQVVSLTPDWLNATIEVEVIV